MCNNNEIKLYFFCDYHNLPRVNRFYDYFTKAQITTKTDREHVTFNFYDPEIDNRASFVLSKIDEVPDIAKLSADYKNIKFHAEFKLVLSSFHISQILNIIQGLNDIYPLYYYSDDLNDKIEPFDKVDILKKIVKKRDEYVLTDELGSVNKQFYINRDILSYVFEYQEKRQLIIDKVKEEHKLIINVNPFIALHKIKHNENHKISFAMDLNLNYLTILPEKIDYFYIPTADGDGNVLIKSDIILRDFGDFFTEYQGFVKGAQITDFEQISKIKKKFARKLKKYERKSSDKNDFDVVELYGLLDRE